MNDLTVEFNQKRDAISRRRGYFDRIQNDTSLSRTELSEVQKKIDLYAKCVSVFQHISKLQMNRMKEAFESFITNGLTAVFPEIEQKAVLEFSERGNLREVDFLISRKMGERWVTVSPYHSSSGGICSVYSFLLRLALLLQQKKGNILNTLVMDESFSMVSSEYQENLMNFLKSLGLQVILVSHNQKYIREGEAIIRIRIEDGVSVIEQ